MTCKQVEKYWEEWLAGSAAPEFGRHLETCPRCRQQAAELARTSDWLALLQREPPEPGPAFWAQLRQRLEEGDSAAEFWTTLGWVAARTALALGFLVMLLGLAVMIELPRPAMAEFDAPQAYVAAGTAAIPVAEGRPNRDQVVLTLVAYTEPQQ